MTEEDKNKIERKLTFNDESWRVAQEYAGLYGEFANIFTALIRQLNNSPIQEPGKFSTSVTWQLRRILKSEACQAPIFFAGKQFRYNFLQEDEIDDVLDVVKVFTPFELSAILGSLYLYRRSKKLSPETEFTFLENDMARRANIATIIGDLIPNIGLGLAIVVANIRHVALGTFLLDDVKVFNSYRKYLRTTNKEIDLEFEYNQWGCTHPEIASKLLVNIGFSADLADSIKKGLLFYYGYPQTATHSKKELAIYNLELKLREVMKKEPTSQVTDPNFVISQEDQQILNTQTEKYLDENYVDSWFKKVSRDIDSEQAPEIYNLHEQHKPEQPQF